MTREVCGTLGACEGFFCSLARLVGVELPVLSPMEIDSDNIGVNKSQISYETELKDEEKMFRAWFNLTCSKSQQFPVAERLDKLSSMNAIINKFKALGANQEMILGVTTEFNRSRDCYGHAIAFRKFTVRKPWSAEAS